MAADFTRIGEAALSQVLLVFWPAFSFQRRSVVGGWWQIIAGLESFPSHDVEESVLDAIRSCDSVDADDSPSIETQGHTKCAVGALGIRGEAQERRRSTRSPRLWTAEYHRLRHTGLPASHGRCQRRVCLGSEYPSHRKDITAEGRRGSQRKEEDAYSLILCVTPRPSEVIPLCLGLRSRCRTLAIKSTREEMGASMCSILRALTLPALWGSGWSSVGQRGTPCPGIPRDVLAACFLSA